MRKRKATTIIAATIVATMGILITMVLMYCYIQARQEQKQQEAIAKEVIRFHVVANSDSENDQLLKLKVKEKVVTYLQAVIKEAKTIEEARQKLTKQLPEVEKIAIQEMKKEGYDYGADATLGNCYFPVKEYGDLIFPAGEYEALQVNLGESKGKNWWCVMYPTLCFIDSTYQVVPDSSKEKLKTSLTQEEYSSLLDGDSVSYGCKLWEWLF